ncbi:MAG TPA: hypothetical protein VEO95_04105 [Chthoniobacteraceae bacterium]|nr:hypothetical protein [Chthoniobacteraceae bacterium]
MNTRAAASNLGQATKDLSIEWQETKSSWRDTKSAEFESKFLDPLPGYISRASLALEELDALLRKVKADCE